MHLAHYAFKEIPHSFNASWAIMGILPRFLKTETSKSIPNWICSQVLRVLGEKTAPSKPKQTNFLSFSFVVDPTCCCWWFCSFYLGYCPFLTPFSGSVCVRRTFPRNTSHFFHIHLFIWFLHTILLFSVFRLLISGSGFETKAALNKLYSATFAFFPR